MTDPARLAAMHPDLILVLRRDGSIVSWSGGEAVPVLRLLLVEHQAWSDWPQVRRLAKACIARRAPLEARICEARIDYELRCTPRGPDEVVCTVRPSLAKDTDATADETSIERRPGLERRGFTRLLRDRVARARLQEKPLAVAVIQIDGISQIAQTIGSRTADRVVDALLRQLGSLANDRQSLFGQIGEGMLALVVEERDRPRIEQRLSRITDVIRQAHEVEGVEFRLDCHSGVSILGLEGATPTHLLDLAGAAADEARRAASRVPRFHSDSVRVRGLERLDLARELRNAVERRQLGFRLVPRHDLETGALSTLIAYMRWPHPLLGEVPPADFLAIAQCVGFGTAMSRALFDQLCAHFERHMEGANAAVRLSFGPLRDHVLDESFVADVLRSCEMHSLPLHRLELRLAERAFVNVDLSELKPLTNRGVRIVVDEVGRDNSSLAALARAPIWGLQIDRAWVTDQNDAASIKVCEAVAALSSALGLQTIATGVDTDTQRERLLKLGYSIGSGDLYSGSTDLR